MEGHPFKPVSRREREDIEKKTDMKKEYSLVHNSKNERERLLNIIKQVVGDNGIRKDEWKRLRRKTWTVNRSPHGHKKAREQFGIDRWQRKRSLVNPSNDLAMIMDRRLVSIEKGQSIEIRVTEVITEWKNG